MDILYLLIPVSVLLVLAIGGIFWWAVASGQFDDLDREGEVIVGDRDAPPRDPPDSP
jgi:cbb3-type cytochrome oxidase maturation protein